MSKSKFKIDEEVHFKKKIYSDFKYHEENVSGTICGVSEEKNDSGDIVFFYRIKNLCIIRPDGKKNYISGIEKRVPEESVEKDSVCGESEIIRNKIRNLMRDRNRVDIQYHKEIDSHNRRADKKREYYCKKIEKINSERLDAENKISDNLTEIETKHTHAVEFIDGEIDKLNEMLKIVGK